MRLRDGRKSKIGIMILFFCLCFSSASTGENDSSVSAGQNAGIKISDSLTLHSGDIITLQTSDGKYLKRYYTRWACDIDAFYSCVTLTEDNKPDAYSEFIVETVGNDQIRLRAKDTERYLHLADYSNEDSFNRDMTWREKDVPAPSYPPVFVRPFIKIEGIRPNKYCSFKVKVINNTNGDDMIALQAYGGNYLNRFDTNIPADDLSFKKDTPISMITVECESPPKDEYDNSVFTVTRTGISPDYVQSISNVTFDTSRLKLSSKPSVIIQFEPQENTGDSERRFIIEDKYTTRKTNKWAFERGIEFAVGTTISANLECEGIGSFGADVSTELTTYQKNTNEIEEGEDHEVTWSQDIPIPPHTRVSAKLTATEAIVDVPFNATVYVKSKNTSNTYSYPINGTYQGTRCLTVKADITEEPLNQTPTITPHVSHTANQPVFITHNPYGG
jgi:hypothetical protein